jgi:hypothetical protein
MGFYPVAVYYNKTQHINNTPHSNTAHKTTQTIRDTLNTNSNEICNVMFLLKSFDIKRCPRRSGFDLPPQEEFMIM